MIPSAPIALNSRTLARASAGRVRSRGDVEHGIEEDSGGGDSAAALCFLRLDRFAVIAAEVANGGDPQASQSFSSYSMGCGIPARSSWRWALSVDESGHDIFAARVDDNISLRALA